MSHVATVEVEIKCLRSLAIAAERCGLVFNEGQTHYRWFGRNYSSADLTKAQADFVRLGLKPGVCEHALSVRDAPDAYEIGVVTHPEKGSYLLLWDDLCDGLGQCVRAKDEQHGMGRLLQMYAVETAKSSLARQGINCREVELPNGSIKLVGTPIFASRA